jgi:agmatine deiminase
VSQDAAFKEGVEPALQAAPVQWPNLSSGWYGPVAHSPATFHHGPACRTRRTVTQRHIDVLRQATDARGRALALTVMRVRTEPASAQANSESSAAGYINHYLCNGGLIMPSLGDGGADRFARQALQSPYPKRKIVQLRVDAVAAGGGGIHCTTQQQPPAEAAPKTRLLYKKDLGLCRRFRP